MVDIYGAGVSPLSGPFPETLQELGLPAPILADMIDPETGEFESLLEGRDPVDAQVLVALSIARGTGAAVLNTGNRFRDARFVSEDDARLIESEARRALALLVSRGDIEILSLTVQSRDDFTLDSGIVDDFLELTVIYLNLRASGERRREESIRVPTI